MDPTRAHILLLLLFTLAFGLVPPPRLCAFGETQGFLSVRGTSIVDAAGRAVLLRGVNYPGYDQSPHPRLHNEADYARFACSGFNVVRLPISWAMLEPMLGTFDISYLTRYVNRDIQWARKYGLFIVLDMHQYKWAHKFGGNGAPEWAVQQYAPTEAGMRKAVSNFWINKTLQDHFCRAWKEIAFIYANEPTIAGYDILNEPWIYTSVIPYLNAMHLDVFYIRVVNSIRAVDPNHIIFLEPANMNTFSFPLKDKIVWSPHFYPLSFASRYSSEDVETLEADLAAKYEKFIVQLKSPMWIGEFGAFMKDESRHRWLQDAMSLFDKYKVGWAWWAFPENGRRSVPTYLCLA